MATYMRNAFGQALLTDFVDEDHDPSHLPTIEVRTHQIPIFKLSICFLVIVLSN